MKNTPLFRVPGKETPAEREERFFNLRESIATELLAKYPKLELVRHKYGIDIVTYHPSYSTYDDQWGDGVVISSRKQGINVTTPNLDSRYLTKQDAREALLKHLPTAQERFSIALLALRQVERTFEVSVGYRVHGDTHGVDDYACIDMDIGGFNFCFRIED